MYDLDGWIRSDVRNRCQESSVMRREIVLFFFTADKLFCQKSSSVPRRQKNHVGRQKFSLSGLERTNDVLVLYMKISGRLRLFVRFPPRIDSRFTCELRMTKYRDTNAISSVKEIYIYSGKVFVEHVVHNYIDTLF